MASPISKDAYVMYMVTMSIFQFGMGLGMRLVLPGDIIVGQDVYCMQTISEWRGEHN